MNFDRMFPDGARVCFVGDSITHMGGFVNQIVSYYRSNFPDRHIEFYNCGIAGGDLRNTIDIYDEDTGVYDPTHIVLMIGVNDSKRWCLSNSDKQNVYDDLLVAYEHFKANLEEFYTLTQQRNIKLILCTPMPYDEYQDTDSPRFNGGYALMLGYANCIEQFAISKGLDLCDYHSAVTRVLQTEILYDADRVHPNQKGHFWMAKTFLAYQGIDFLQPITPTEDIEEWYNITQKLRDIFATEFLVVSGYINLSDTERYSIISAKQKKMEAKMYNPGSYVGRLINEYVKNKKFQSEYVNRLKNFMKR